MTIEVKGFGALGSQDFEVKGLGSIWALGSEGLLSDLMNWAGWVSMSQMRGLGGQRSRSFLWVREFRACFGLEALLRFILGVEFVFGGWV